MTKKMHQAVSAERMMDKTDKIAEMLDTFTVKIDGERRPIVFGALIAAGLRTLRPNADPDAYRQVRAQFATFILTTLNNARPQKDRLDIDLLTKRVTELESTAAKTGAFTETEMQYIRTICGYGMSAKQVATLYGVDVERIKVVLKRRDIPIVWASKIRSRLTKSPGRKIDIDG